MRPVRILRWVLGAVLLALSLAVVPSGAHARTTDDDARQRQATGSADDRGQREGAYRHACDPSPGLDKASCHSLISTDPAPLASVPPGGKPEGLTPRDLRSTYDLPRRAGEGRTVAVVVAFNYPTAENDLAVYRRQFHLPPCTTANGCFREINQSGGTTPPPTTDPGWAVEAALDIEMVSATCPTCNVLLVEANDDTIGNLLTAVAQARTQGAKFISMSWGTDVEHPFQLVRDQTYFNHPGIAFVASSGDRGFPNLNWPAASQFVTGVGGTRLERSRQPGWEPHGGQKPRRRGWLETAWPGAGSGCSLIQPKPPFQQDAGCTNRTVADVSAVAENVALYTTTPDAGWLTVAGTSVSTPIIAGVYALAGNPGPNDRPNSYPYARPWALNDIVEGSNGSCGGSYLCTAVPGYDGPTGIGTPNGVRGFRA